MIKQLFKKLVPAKKSALEAKPAASTEAKPKHGEGGQCCGGCGGSKNK